jgi:hypothetical protein
MKSSAKGLFSSSVSATTKATTNNIASNLTANNLTIETTKEDIVLLPLSVELTAVFLILPSKSSAEV